MIEQRSFGDRMGTQSYLLMGENGGEALLVDPTLENLDLYQSVLQKSGCRLVATLETGAVPIARQSAIWLARHWGCANVTPCDLVMDPRTVRVGSGDVIELAGLEIVVIGTVGGVNDAVSYSVEGRVFVGARSEFEDPELLRLPLGTPFYRSLQQGAPDIDVADLQLQGWPSLAGDDVLAGDFDSTLEAARLALESIGSPIFEWDEFPKSEGLCGEFERVLDALAPLRIANQPPAHIRTLHLASAKSVNSGPSEERAAQRREDAKNFQPGGGNDVRSIASSRPLAPPVSGPDSASG